MSITLKSTEKHFVEFRSPGTFFNETSEHPIEAWDTHLAAQMFKNINERHGAKPYGFFFRTIKAYPEMKDEDGNVITLSAQKVPPKKSGFYWLGGDLIKHDDMPEIKDNRVLRDNMHCNRWWIICRNNNSYLYHGPFEENDSLLDQEGNIVKRGSDPDLVEYRAKKNKEKDDEKDTVDN